MIHNHFYVAQNVSDGLMGSIASFLSHTELKTTSSPYTLWSLLGRVGQVGSLAKKSSMMLV